MIVVAVVDETATLFFLKGCFIAVISYTFLILSKTYIVQSNEQIESYKKN